MFSKRSGNFNRNAFKAKIEGKDMAEWLYKQKVNEVSVKHEDFKIKAVHELMRKLSDIEDKNNLDSYNAITDLRLELTAKAHGQNLSAEEIETIKKIPKKEKGGRNLHEICEKLGKSENIIIDLMKSLLKAELIQKLE